MSITVKSTFGEVMVDGLFCALDLARMFADLYADEDVREALVAAVSAQQDVDADDGKSATASGYVRHCNALDVIAEHVPTTAVELTPDDARRLRELLIKARLGQGRAESAYRRSA